MLKSLFLTLLTLTFGACNSASNSSDTKPVSSTEEKAVVKRSRFVDRLSTFIKTLQSAKPLASSTPFRWDFSTVRTVAYDYEQEMHVDVTGKDSPVDMAANGTLVFNVRDGETADIVIKDVKIKMSDRGQPEQTMDQPLLMTVHGIKSDGTKEAGKRSDEWYVRALFPLPEKVLALGESTEVPFQIPMDAQGTTLYAKGAIRLTLARYVEVNGHTCALLETVVTVPGIEVPKGVEGRYELQLHGEGITVFDLEDKIVASAQLAIVLDMSVESPSSGEPRPEADRSMGMKQDHFISVTRNSGKD